MPEPAAPESPERVVCVIHMDSPLRSKSNYRRSRAGSARSPEWAKQRAFEDELAVVARAARPAGWPLGNPDLPVAQRPTVVVLVAARTLLDTANMAKSVTDALQGVLFVNDASVRHVACVATRARSDQDVTILVEVLAPGAELDAVFASAALLANDYQRSTPSPDR